MSIGKLKLGRKKGVKPNLLKTLLALILFIILQTGCSRKEEQPAAATQAAPVTLREKPQQGETQRKVAAWGDAPDFTLPKLGGGDFRLSSLSGKVIILDFWATYCPPCRMEIPDFVTLYKKYQNQGLEIVGVALDRDGERVVAPFAEKFHINYTILLGDRAVTKKYGGIRYIPTTFLIDRGGNIVKKYVGFTAKEVFEKEVKKLLAQNK